MYKMGDVFTTDRDPKIEYVVEEIVEEDEDEVTYFTGVLVGDKHDRKNTRTSFYSHIGTTHLLTDDHGREVTCTVIAKMDISFINYRKVLTEEQKQRYLDTNGTECPFCREHIDNRITDDIELSGSDEAYQSVNCSHCNVTWREFFEVELKMSYITDL